MKTLGTGVDTIQDFTSNLDLIYEALIKVAARQPPVPGAPPDGRIQAVISDVRRAVPGPTRRRDLLRHQPGRTRASGRGPHARRSLRAAQRALRHQLLLDLDYEAASPPVGLSVRIVPHQAGSPVSIVESMSPLDDGYASVVLRDDADKAIRSVTLAALVRPADPAMATPQVFIRRGPSVILLPRATTAIAVQLIEPVERSTRSHAKAPTSSSASSRSNSRTARRGRMILAAKGRFERH